MARIVFAAALALAAGAAIAQAPPEVPSSACLTDGRIEDVLIVGDTVFLAGRFTHVRPPGTDPGDPQEVARNWFAACDLASGAPLAWNPQVACQAPASCANARGETLAMAPGGGSLLVGGKFSHAGGALRSNVARVALGSGAVEPWNPGADDRVNRVVPAPDGGRIYLAGSFTAAGGCAPAPCHAHLAAVEPASGAVVDAFDPAIESDGGAFTTVHALDFSADGGTVFLGGVFDSVNGVARSSAAAVDAATGAITTPFEPRLDDPDPLDPRVQIFDLVHHLGQVYLCGDWWITDGLGGEHDQRNVNRFEAINGEVDLDFWISTDAGVQACALDAGSGLLVVGGSFECVRAWTDSTTPSDPSAAQCGPDPLFFGTVQRDLFALDLAEGDLQPWNPDPEGASGTWAVAVGSGRWTAAGDSAWPRTGPPSHVNLLSFDLLALFADGFESGDTASWSATAP